MVCILLEELENQQIPWGIVTNKPRWLSESLLNALNLARHVRYWSIQKMLAKLARP